MNELSNHDHSRFLTRTSQKVGRCDTLMHASAETGVKKPVMREAVMVQMTWPGAPTIYYGDEAGVCGFTDPDNRRTYPWGKEDKEMIRFHKEMIRIHKAYRELKTGSVKELFADNNVICYGRFNREAATVVFINNNEFEVTKDIDVSALGIPLDARLSQLILTDGSGFRTEIGSSKVKNGILTITLSRLSGLVLRYDSHAPISTEEFWADNTLDFG